MQDTRMGKRDEWELKALTHLKENEVWLKKCTRHVEKLCRLCWTLSDFNYLKPFFFFFDRRWSLLSDLNSMNTEVVPVIHDSLEIAQPGCWNRNALSLFLQTHEGMWRKPPLWPFTSSISEGQILLAKAFSSLPSSCRNISSFNAIPWELKPFNTCRLLSSAVEE